MTNIATEEKPLGDLYLENLRKATCHKDAAVSLQLSVTTWPTSASPAVAKRFTSSRRRRFRADGPHHL